MPRQAKTSQQILLHFCDLSPPNGWTFQLSGSPRLCRLHCQQSDNSEQPPEEKTRLSNPRWECQNKISYKVPATTVPRALTAGFIVWSTAARCSIGGATMTSTILKKSGFLSTRALMPFTSRVTDSWNPPQQDKTSEFPCEVQWPEMCYQIPEACHTTTTNIRACR